MTLKLTLFSQEKEDFVREILIDSDAKFFELHKLILDDCNYDEHQKQCFLICDDDWRVKQRISLHDSEEMGYDQDLNLMSDTSKKRVSMAMRATRRKSSTLKVTR